MSIIFWFNSHSVSSRFLKIESRKHILPSYSTLWQIIMLFFKINHDQESAAYGFCCNCANVRDYKMLVKTAFCSPYIFIFYFLNILAIIHFLDHWCHNTLIYVIFHKHVALPTTVIYQTCSLSCFISTMGAYYACYTTLSAPRTTYLLPLPLFHP